MTAAFVIGATGGLGRASAHALAREWPGIALTYRSDSSKAEALARELPSDCTGLPVHCDLADTTSITTALATAADHFGGIGTVVFASGVAISQPFVSQTTEAQWREVIETELIGLTRVVSATLPLFRAQRGGNFVIVVSVANYAYPPGDALSAVPKAAMESLDDPDDRAAGLLALRTVAEAYGGLGAVAAEAGISRESLYRALSPKGNPTLKTLLAVLKAVGMKLSVEPENQVAV